MKILLIIILAAISSYALSDPSFNCSGNINRAESIVCSDYNLSNSDKSLNETYAKIIKEANRETVSKIKSDQLKWLKKRNDSNCNKECIESLYNERNSELVEYYNKDVVKNDPCRMIGPYLTDKACAVKEREESEKKLKNAFDNYLSRNIKVFEHSRDLSIQVHKTARINEFEAWKNWRDNYCKLAYTNTNGGSGAGLYQDYCHVEVNNDKAMFYE